MYDIDIKLASSSDQQIYRQYKFYSEHCKKYIELIRCFPRDGDFIHSLDIKYDKKNSLDYTNEFINLVDRNALQQTRLLRFHNWGESSFYVFDFWRNSSAFSRLETLNICHTKITGVELILPQLRHITLIDNEIDVFPIECLANNLLTLELRGTGFVEPVDLSHLHLLQRVTFVGNNLRLCPILSKSFCLTYLDISFNQIARIENLPDSIHELMINDNLVEHIDKFPNLIVSVNMWSNPIKQLPANLLLCQYLSYIHLHNTELVLNVMEQRFLDRCQNPQLGSKSVYQDLQNIHNSAVQKSLLVSCNNLFRDNLTNRHFTTCGDKISDDLIRNYMQLPDRHCTLQVTYAEIFQKVWNRIVAEKEPNHSELVRRLREETLESEGVCFMGKITRLVNVLSGFSADINICIGEADQINAKITAHRARNQGNINFGLLEKELAEVVDQVKVKEWIKSIQEYEDQGD